MSSPHTPPSLYIRTSTLSYISRTSVLLSPSTLSIGSKCVLEPSTKIGENVRMARGVRVNQGAQIGVVSNPPTPNSGDPVDPPVPCTIGKNSYISSSVYVSPSCTIGSSVFVGSSSCISASVRIPDNCKVLPGTRVPEGRTYPEGVVIGGERGEVVGETDEGWKEIMEFRVNEGWGRINDIEGGGVVWEV